MTHDELIEALRRLTDEIAEDGTTCFDCSREHNCSTRGCAILREAVEELELQKKFFNCKIVQPMTPDYPAVAYCIHDHKSYSFLKLGDVYFVPLFQVVDVLLGIKPDVVIRDGIRYCNNCGAKLDGEEDGDG